MELPQGKLKASLACIVKSSVAHRHRYQPAGGTAEQGVGMVLRSDAPMQWHQVRVKCAYPAADHPLLHGIPGKQQG
jgi:hypothetical protein